MIKKIVVLLISALCGLTACTPKRGQELVVYVPKTLSAIPLLELAEKPVDGYPLKTVFYQDNSMAMAEFLTGKCDFFFTGFTQGAFHAAGDPSVLHFATLVWGVSSLVALDPGLKTLTDFTGRKIAVPFAKSPLDLQLQAILKQAAITGVQIEYTPLPQAIPMLVNGRVDGVCLPEPQASQVIANQNAHEVFWFPAAWAQWMQADKMTPQVSLFVRSEFAAKHASLLAAMARSLKAPLPYSPKQQAALADKYAPLFQLDAALLQQAIGKTLYSLPDSPTAAAVSEAYLRQIAAGTEPGADFYYKY